MNLFLLYLLMLKATVTTFNGPMSLPVLREELVVKRRILTDGELAGAVAAAQGSPGPMGIYVVSVGYFAAGVPGAIAGYLALITPAFIAVPLIRRIGRRLEHPRGRSALDAAVLASSGLILTSAGPLARASIDDWFRAAIAAIACIMVAATRVPTVVLIAASLVLGAITALPV